MSPPQPFRRSVAIGVGAGLTLLLALVVAAVVFLAPDRSPAVSPAPSSGTNAPGSASPPATAPSTRAPTSSGTAGTPSPSTTPTAPVTPSPSPTPVGPNTTLKNNSLYRVDLKRSSTSCRLTVRSPKPPLKNKALAPYLRDVVDCLVRTFDEPLAAQGFTLTAPKIKTYTKTISTPCGKYGQNKAPAFYCSATETIYWPQTGDDGNEAYTFARLGYVGLLAHEFGHHLQHTTGMLTAYAEGYYEADKKSPRYLLSRRLELQAQCFEGVFLNATTRSLRLTSYDRSQLRTWHGYTGDEDPPSDRLPDHGTSAAQRRWLDRGIDSGDFGRCNTWTAKKSAVK